MGLFKKKTVDSERSNASKEKMRQLFDSTVPEGNSYQIAYAYSQTVKVGGVLVRKVTNEWTSLIVGYRASDMSLVLLPVSKDFDAAGDMEIFKKDNVKKTTGKRGYYVVYRQGGMMAGYVDFTISAVEFDEDYLAYVSQPEESSSFEEFFKEFSKK